MSITTKYKILFTGLALVLAGAVFLIFSAAERDDDKREACRTAGGVPVEDADNIVCLETQEIKL